MPEITSKNFTISNADVMTLPIGVFHLLILVEPDPEGWAPAPIDEAAFEDIATLYNQLIADELSGWDGEDIELHFADDLEFVDETRVIWVGEDAGEVYNQVAEIYSTVKFAYLNIEGDFFTELGYYLHGLYTAHPEFQVAIVGATMENEVMDVGNLVSEIGFKTTILTRYCLSQDAFVNLDELFAQVHARRKMMREMGYSDEEIWGSE